MRDIWSYGVKFPYGYSAAYGSTFHNGEDWTVTDRRTDIPVTVNGVVIGIAGTTGRSDGIHLHVGKWIGGKHYPPEGGGAILPNASVHSTGYDDTNGNYVRVSSNGVIWVYLHLSQIKVSQGQQLKGGNIMDESKVYELLNERDKRMDTIQKGLDDIYKILDENLKGIGSRLEKLEKNPATGGTIVGKSYVIDVKEQK